MRAKLILLAVMLAIVNSSRASSQTLSLAVGDQGALTRSLDIVTGELFDVVTIIDTAGNEFSAAEWVQTDLRQLNPGIFMINKLLICNTCDWFGGEPGEHFVFGLCLPPSDGLELMRITYADFSDAAGNDLVLTTRGFGPGDTQPSSFEGSPGFVDCDNAKFPLVVSGGDAWMTGAGVVVPSGAVVLNPTPPLVVGAVASSLSLIKATYR